MALGRRLQIEFVPALPCAEFAAGNEHQRAGESEDLSRAFLATGALPATAESDSAHLAIATAAGADYLLTWNCRHLANAQILHRLERAALDHGWTLPNVCTPAELMGELPDESESDS